MDRLVVFDTTLRDGEQSPGASMNASEKLEIALALEDMKVDVIEAGFPITSPGDFEAVVQISKTIKNSTICALARAVDMDIERAGQALAHAASPRLHTFIATSPIHMQHKLNLKPDAVKAKAVAAVKKARQYTDDVEFSAEDAGRSELPFLCDLIEAVIDAGARTINIPDTVGYCLPWEFGELVGAIIKGVPNADKAIFSVHCHNDLGLAVANTLSAVKNGARQVECTINGIGERAGNAALEELVMAVKTRPMQFNCQTDVDASKIVPLSQLVSRIIHFPVQPNKAIVGENAFAHESGIHQDGMLKSPETYEIMKAESVGWPNNKLVLGKHSGRNAFHVRLKPLASEIIDADTLKLLFADFKVLADVKHDISDSDLKSLLKNRGIACQS